MSKPLFSDDTVCPSCNKGAVVMHLPASANEEQVYWCEAGHVVVQSKGQFLRPRLVHEFNREDY